MIDIGPLYATIQMHFFIADFTEQKITLTRAHARKQ